MAKNPTEKDFIRFYEYIDKQNIPLPLMDKGGDFCFIPGFEWVQKEKERLMKMIITERKLMEEVIIKERIKSEQGILGERDMPVIVGVDEAGRGPMAGPVVAGAVAFNKGYFFMPGINDSKKISENMREILYKQIEKYCVYGVGIGSAQEIDELNIHGASLLSMKRAVEELLKKK